MCDEVSKLSENSINERLHPHLVARANPLAGSTTRFFPLIAVAPRALGGEGSLPLTNPLLVVNSSAFALDRVLTGCVFGGVDFGEDC